MTTGKKSEAAALLEGLAGPLTLSSLLVAEREAEGWSQTEMANRLGITRAHLCDIEKGRKTVSVERAVAWARDLGFSEEQYVRLALQAQLDAAGIVMEVAVRATTPAAKRTRTAAPRARARA